VALLYDGAREPDMVAESLNSLVREVMVVCSCLIRSMVVRFLLVFSSGVVGSSPLFWASGICLCSCTMGACESDTLNLAVRFAMLGPSDDSERDGLGDAKPPAWGLPSPRVTSGKGEGRIGGTLGEKRDTCGVLLELPPSAAATDAKDHVSL
jgi:hypothetical protein